MPSQMVFEGYRLIESDFPPEFYSQNTFDIYNPQYAFKWLQQIEPENGKLLTKIELHVDAFYSECPREDPYDFPVLPPPHSNGNTWYLFLETLRQQAPNVREISVRWDALPSMREELGTFLGGGVDVNFVRALGRFQGLEVLRLDGYYAKEWPAYLEEKTGAQVLEAHEHKHWRCMGILEELRKFQSLYDDRSP